MKQKNGIKGPDKRSHSAVNLETAQVGSAPLAYYLT